MQNNNKQDYIFDILGITSREDSYTGLICNAFQNLEEFRKNIIENFFELKTQMDKTWKVKVRPNVSYVKKDEDNEKSRTKDCPDMIFYSVNDDNIENIVIVENKIFSGEGWKQTERYVSDKFKNQIKNFEGKNTENAKYKYIYLTLDGEKPASDEFNPKSYDELIKCIPNKLGNSKLETLLDELRLMIQERLNFPLPKDDDTSKGFLDTKSEGLVNNILKFRRLSNYLFENLRKKENFKDDFGLSGNRANTIYLYQLWKKGIWASDEIDKQKYSEPNYHIHFELQFRISSSNYLELCLHYETNPYLYRQEFKKKGKEIVELYDQKREAFYNKFNEKKEELENWSIGTRRQKGKNSNQIAKIKLNKKPQMIDFSVFELKQFLEVEINTITPIITDCINSILEKA